MNDTEDFLKRYNFNYIGVKKESWDALYHAIYNNNKSSQYVRVTKEVALEILKRIDLTN